MLNDIKYVKGLTMNSKNQLKVHIFLYVYPTRICVLTHLICYEPLKERYKD